ncbi:MAG: hypothetical protein AAGH88_13855 [Planctomycetota bacterium]
MCLLIAAYFADLSIPIVDNPYRLILDQVEAEGAAGLDMGAYQEDTPCGTTYCMAGATCAGAGEAGMELQEAFGWDVAAGLIHAASLRAAGKPVRVPDYSWGRSDEDAMAEIMEGVACG